MRTTMHDFRGMIVTSKDVTQRGAPSEQITKALGQVPRAFPFAKGGWFYMSNCKYYVATQPGERVNCANCKRWSGTRCKDEQRLIERYEDTKEFEFYDRMMRKNKGVDGPL